MNFKKICFYLVWCLALAAPCTVRTVDQQHSNKRTMFSSRTMQCIIDYPPYAACLLTLFSLMTQPHCSQNQNGNNSHDDDDDSDINFLLSIFLYALVILK